MTSETSPPRRKATGILARLLFGAFIPAATYGAVLMQLPSSGGAPEYRGLEVLFDIGGGVIVLLFNCWVPFISWKTVPNAFFAGMIAPCLALSLECYWGGTSRDEYYRLTACAVPVSTAILFCIYQAWRYRAARLRSSSPAGTDGPRAVGP